ncbi:MAG: hypothetical protein PVI21_02355 [Candidatus Woesebacteria bacterium]|jgi:hypothetical protein
MVGGHIKSFPATKNLAALLSWVGVVLLAFVFSSHSIAAQDAAAISQGFDTSETNIAAGAVVSLESENKGKVQLANTERISQMIGVIGDDPLVSLSGDTSKVQVVISGNAPTLVSNINGDIVTGDKITASPLDGVGMKATNSTQIIGTAQDDFGDIQTTELTITDKNGQPQVIRTGLLPVQVNVTYYAMTEDSQKTFLPEFLRQVANSVAGREVSVMRVLMSLLILILGFVSSGVMLYSSVQSSIISIGRNPLSESAVQKSLLQVGATALGILLVMAIAIYLILTT